MGGRLRILLLAIVPVLMIQTSALAQVPTQEREVSPSSTSPPSPMPDRGEVNIDEPPSPMPDSGEVNIDESQQPQESEPQDNEDKQPQEPEPQDAEQAEVEADNIVPKTEQNPFNRPDIDKLIQQEFSEDMWRIMRGGLPCLETSANCLQQLQDKAVGQSPLLQEIDARIQEANDKIAEARSANKKAVNLAVLTPALQYLLGTSPANTDQRAPGLIDNIAKLFTGDLNLINGLLRVVGVPLFEKISGGNASAQQRSIQISDLAIKVAELQRGRAQLADTIKEKVAVALVRFDEARTDFQTAQVVSTRAVLQFRVSEMVYTRGDDGTESYLAQQNRLDNIKAQTYSSWAKMRRALFELKLLVLSVKDAEI
jgi:hypothetical protein